MAAATAGSSPSPTSWASWSASSSCWSRSPIRTSRSCRSSPARCATPSACRTMCAIPASSRSTACRPGRSSRTPPTSSPRTPPPTPTPDEHDHSREYGAHFKNDHAFALAAASLRQALQDMPELTEASKHIMIEETKEGLNIEIVDQDGRSMFPEGSKEPYERTRKHHPEARRHRSKRRRTGLSITGHTSATRDAAAAGLRTWNLSADRANAVRQILEEEGYAVGQFLRGGRQGRHRSAVPRRSLHGGQSPRNHHA